jgi:predicted kinase
MRESQVIEDVDKLRKALGKLPDPVAKPSLVVVSGLPGTGKSYFCRRLAEMIPLVIVESDRLRRLLFPYPRYSAQESFRLFQACYRLVEELLRSGITVALDATNLEERHRERLYHIADQMGAALVIVWTDAPLEVVSQRLEGRKSMMDPGDQSEADLTVYHRMRPTVERIRRSHLVVDTSKDIGAALDKVVRRLSQ